MKKPSKFLKDFFQENGLNYEWRIGEHAGCWDKGCSHPVNELNIWRGNDKRFSWSFEEGCSDEMIVNNLTDRLSKL